MAPGSAGGSPRFALEPATATGSSRAPATTAEVRIARYLESRCDERVLFLHDRAIPCRRSRVDLIAVAPTGIWVVRAQLRPAGKVRRTRPLRGSSRLRIGRHDSTWLIDGLARQVEAVEGTLRRLGHRLQPRGVLCFLDGGLPLLRPLSVGDFALLYPGQLVRELGRPGPIHHERAELLAAQLGERLPPA